MQNPLVSVVIPTRNEEKALETLLESLKKQTYKRYEIVVVDGGSTDNTAKVAKKYGARLIKETGKYRSPANARNIGMEEAKGDIIALFDCDSEVNNKFLEEGIKAFSSKEVMGVSVNYNKAEDTAVEKILVSRLKTCEMKNPTPAFTRKGFLKKIGGWDASLGYGEDRKINRRIYEYNKEHDSKALKHAKGAVIVNHLPHTTKEIFAQQRWYGRTICHFLKKEGNIEEYVALFRVFYVIVLISILMAIFQAPFWLPMMVISAPFIISSVYKTFLALVRGSIFGFGIFFMDIIMGIAFTYGLIEYIFRKNQRGRD